MSKTVKKVNVKKAMEKRQEVINLVMKNIETIEKLHISLGNSKMGVIPSFSVMPLVTCKNCGDCSNFCYACKGCFNFNNNVLNLAENTALLKVDPEQVEKSINDFLNNSTIIYKYFRFNVSGDIFSVDYLEMIVSIAKKNQFTRFLVFTKNYELINTYLDCNELPSNLVIVFSRWNNTTIDNKHNLPIAITKIDENTNIPENAFHCNGDCSNCLNCWNAEKGDYRYFDLH